MRGAERRVLREREKARARSAGDDGQEALSAAGGFTV